MGDTEEQHGAGPQPVLCSGPISYVKTSPLGISSLEGMAGPPGS